MLLFAAGSSIFKMFNYPIAGVRASLTLGAPPRRIRGWPAPLVFFHRYPLPEPTGYSYLKASMGSRFAAFMAGGIPRRKPPQKKKTLEMVRRGGVGGTPE